MNGHSFLLHPRGLLFEIVEHLEGLDRVSAGLDSASARGMVI